MIYCTVIDVALPSKMRKTSSRLCCPIEAGTSWLIRGGVTYLFYQGVEQAFEAVLPHDDEESAQMSRNLARTASLCVSAAGVVLWVKCAGSTMRSLHDSYDSDWRAEPSSLRELQSVVGEDNVSKFRASVAEYIPEVQSEYLGNFSRRVAGVTVGELFDRDPSASAAGAGSVVVEEVDGDDGSGASAGQAHLVLEDG